jgi:hypothetical protein
MLQIAQQFIPVQNIEFLRATGLRQFEQCPFIWASQYLQPGGTKEGISSESARIGTAAHKIIEDHLAKIGFMIGSLVRDETIAQLLEAEAITAWAVIPETERPNLIRYLESLNLLMDEGWGPFALEHEFLIHMSEALPPIKGHIDCLLWNPTENMIMILDHKTNRKYDGHEFWKMDIQPAVYAWAVSQLYPQIPRIKFQIGYVNIDTQVSWSIDDTMHQELVTRVLGLWGKMLEYSQTNSWPVTLNNYCGWCAYNNTCPETAGAMTKLHESFITKTQEMSIGEKHQWMKSIIKSANVMLAEIETELVTELQDGPKKFGDLVYSVKFGETRKADFLPIYEMLITYASSPEREDLSELMEDIFSVKVLGIDKLVKKVPQLKSVIENIIYKQISEKPTIVAKASKDGDFSIGALQI